MIKEFGIVEVIESNNSEAFKTICESLLQAGYVMKACSCGFVSSEIYDFCSTYQAVFVRKEYA